MNSIDLNQALTTLGSILEDQGLKFELVAIGGGALLLLGTIIRPTNDLDIVALVDERNLISARPLPPPLLKAIDDVGKAFKLPSHWINSAPADLWESGLPTGFQQRLERIDYKGLILYCASRFDQICFKLYASVDQGSDSKHYHDLKLLYPTSEELNVAATWCKTQDVSEPFKQCLDDLLTLMEG
jgi:hypothetical protein